MKKLLKKLPPGIQYILLVYATGMLVFSIFRLLLLALHTDELKEIPASVIFQSLLMGLRFDAVINGYLLSIPAFILFLFSIARAKGDFPARILSVFIVVVYSLAFLIHVSDIRWFEHGASRFTVAALQWTNTPGWMLKFVFQDVPNYPFIALLIILIFLFSFLVRRIRNSSYTEQAAEFSVVKNISVFLLLFGLMLIGMRGRLAEKSPIRWGTAFFSPYNFANQLGLNPVYTFMRSWMDQQQSRDVRYNFMSDADAEETVRTQLGDGQYEEAVSPVARKIRASGNPLNYNIVLVLMESMTSKNMQHFGNAGKLTPFLDSLYDRSISFSDFYSDGNHTFNGIYSSLYGWHSLPMVHHMKDLTHQQAYGGLPVELRSRGYRTVFFTTHDDQFDNMAGFLLPNGFEKIISEKDFPRKDVLSTLGVPDHVLFDRALLEMDAMKNRNERFFVGMITGSNHEPLVLPENIPFQAHSPGLEEQVVEYSDWAVGKFLHEAASRPWFDSTVFVLTGDHGGLVDGFDHYLAFHHVPLIIYAPKLFPQPEVMSSVGGQADIYATVCGLLNLSYTNNSMGIDLLKSQRRFYPFNFDEELCCVTTENFFTIGHDQERFYKLADDKMRMAATEKSLLADSMKTFLQAAIQTTQRMIETRKMK